MKKLIFQSNIYMIYYQLKNKIRFYFIVESELNYEEKNFNNYRFAY